MGFHVDEHWGCLTGPDFLAIPDFIHSPSNEHPTPSTFSIPPMLCWGGAGVALLGGETKPESAWLEQRTGETGRRLKMLLKEPNGTNLESLSPLPEVPGMTG